MVMAGGPSVTLRQWSERGTLRTSLAHSPPQAPPPRALQKGPVAIAKFTSPLPEHPTHHDGILLLSRSPASGGESCESGHRPPRLAVPFLPLFPLHLMTFIYAQLPDHSL